MNTPIEALKRPYWVVVGTRPEVIKQVSVYWGMCDVFGRDQVALIGSGQHKELLTQALSHFGAELDTNLELMRAGQTLAESAARILDKITELLKLHRPKVVIVQGDTTTAAMTAIAAFHLGIRVVHNEAGLRTFDPWNPYPEEANRKWISAIANHHMAPTLLAKQRLMSEGTNEAQISVVGNPGIDSLFWTLKETSVDLHHPVRIFLHRTRLKPVLVTAHRRENDESAMDRWFDGLKQFLSIHPALALICPAHPNNRARAAMEKYLGGHPQVVVCDPIDYGQLCHLLMECAFVVSDSGGIQEETATLKVPCVVVRKTTERPEAIAHGTARLANPDSVSEILDQMKWANAQSLLSNDKRVDANSPYGEFPFGQGDAGIKTARRIRELGF